MKKYKVKPVTIVTEPNHIIKAEVFIIYFLFVNINMDITIELTFAISNINQRGYTHPKSK